MSLVNLNLFGKIHILMNSHLENVPSLTKILDLALRWSSRMLENVFG